MIAKGVALVAQGALRTLRHPLQQLILAIAEREDDQVLLHLLVQVLEGLDCADVAEQLLVVELLELVLLLAHLGGRVVVQLDGAGPGEQQLPGPFVFLLGPDGEEMEGQRLQRLDGLEERLMIQLHL